MYNIELFVKLKVPDVVAITAKNTLIRRMNYKNILKDLTREEYWNIAIDTPDKEQAKKLGLYLAEQTPLFVNPNKHKFYLKEINESLEEKILLAKDLYKIGILVSYIEDAKANILLAVIRNRFGIKNVVDLKRGILWTCLIKAKDKNEAEIIANEIAMAKKRTCGLLVNTHFQTCRIIS